VQDLFRGQVVGDDVGMGGVRNRVRDQHLAIAGHGKCANDDRRGQTAQARCVSLHLETLPSRPRFGNGLAGSALESKLATRIEYRERIGACQRSHTFWKVVDGLRYRATTSRTKPRMMPSLAFA
jgi:hypothetical protein